VENIIAAQLWGDNLEKNLRANVLEKKKSKNGTKQSKNGTKKGTAKAGTAVFFFFL